MLLNLATHRKKVDWLRKDPHATFLLMNPANAYHWLSIRCTVARELSEDDPARASGSPTSWTGSGSSTPATSRPTRCATRRSTSAGCCSSFEVVRVATLRARPSRQRRRRRAVGECPASRSPAGRLGGLTAALVLRRRRLRRDGLRAVVGALQARGAGIAALVRHAALPRPSGAAGTSARRRARAARTRSSASSGRRQRPARAASTATCSPPGTRSTGRCSPSSTAERYLLGQEVVGFAPDGDGVAARAAPGGQPAQADLLVCADGIELAARARLLPEVRPSYAGLRRLARHAARGRADPATPPALARRDHLPGAARTATSSSTPSPGPDGRCRANGWSTSSGTVNVAPRARSSTS